MKRKEITTIVTVLLVPMAFMVGTTETMAMETAFTYQGRLMDANAPEDGSYDFQFRLYNTNDPCVGNQLGSTVEVNDLYVINGYFTVDLDFGSDVFDGDRLWLGIAVRPGDSNDVYTFLNPLQEVTPTPYALYAKAAGNAIGGSGTTNRIIKFTGPNTLGDSALYEDNYYVGVGTASPRGMFDVDCDGGDIYLDTFSSQVHIGDVEGDGDGTCFTVDDNSGKFTFENGNVGIGTKLPDKKLTVKYGDFAVYPAQSEPSIITNGYNVKLGDPYGIGNQAFLEIDDPGSRFVFNNANVGIGTTTPRASLEVANSGSSHAIWASTSDIPVYAHRTSTSGTWPAVAGDCNSQASGASGVRGRILSTTPGSLGAGVYGYNYGTGSNGVGVRGYHAGSGAGVYGQCVYGKGVQGVTTFGYAGYFTGGKNYFEGNVGIGTTSPAVKLHVVGMARVEAVQITGADVAEKFPVSEEVRPGMVVTIDTQNQGQLCLSRGAYNRCVAGVVSGAKGLPAGAILGNLPGHEDAVPIALSGRVWVYCDTTEKAVEPGDMLTTSPTAGHAMAVTDYTKAHGAVLGKAMTSLEKGQTGLVLTLINLQ